MSRGERKKESLIGYTTKNWSDSFYFTSARYESEEIQRGNVYKHFYPAVFSCADIYKSEKRAMENFECKKNSLSRVRITIEEV